MSSITRLLTAVDLTDRELAEDVSRFGNCAGTPDDATFFPDHEITPEDARAACAGCPVVAECLERALRVEATPYVQPHGIYGARSPEERRNLLRGRQRRARRILVRGEDRAVA
jgi:Transcription factor WhiB